MKKESNLSLLMNWGGRDKNYLLVSAALGILSGFLILVPYMATYRILNGLYFDTMTREVLIRIGIWTAVFIALKIGLKGTSGILSHLGAFNIMLKIRKMIVDRLARVPMGYLNERETGEFKKVINEDVEQLELFMAHKIPDFFTYLITPVVLFSYLATINIKLALLSLIPVPIGLLLQIFIFSNYSRYVNEFSSASAKLNSTIVEHIRGMKLIKGYNLKVESFKKYSDAIDGYDRVWRSVAKAVSPPFGVFHVILQCGILLLLPVGGSMFLTGRIAAGSLILFVFVGTYYLSVLRPLMELGSTFAQTLSVIGNINKIFKIPLYGKGTTAFPKSGDIEFNNLGFSYDGEHRVLGGLSFRISEGEKIAIVGKSGAGKTTALQLIARYYDATEGSVMIGGTDVRDIDYETLLVNMSIVFQDSFLLRGTITENIRMGVDGDMEQVIAAAKRAQIHDFIMSLPDGYETRAGSHAVRFSGGEKQRIAIARAIFKDAPILLLDEAGSAADPENQYEIEKAIDSLCEGKTVVVVAHRLEIVKKCSRILVIENGGITGFAPHDKLLETNEYYSSIWDIYNRSLSIDYKKDSEAVYNETL